MKKPIGKLLAIAIAMGASTASAQAPRTLPTGAPACGNSNTKAVSKCQRAERELEAARRELVAALSEERVYVRKGVRPPLRLVDPGTRTAAHATRVEIARSRVDAAEQTLQRDADFDALRLMNPQSPRRNP